MIENKPIVNRVANSGILTVNLEHFLPNENDVCSFDLKEYLFMELILKEKDFRAAMKEHDWTKYDGKHVALFCSNDAIIPVWAFMMVSIYLDGHAVSVHQKTEEELKNDLLLGAIQSINKEEYIDKRVVIKGCSDIPIPNAAYVAITSLLKPVVKTLMYGEPCSMVPLYKQKK